MIDRTQKSAVYLALSSGVVQTTRYSLATLADSAPGNVALAGPPNRQQKAPNQTEGCFFVLRQLWHRRSCEFHFCQCWGSLVFLSGEYINVVIKTLRQPNLFGIFFIPPKTSKVYGLFFVQPKPLASFFLSDFFGEVIGEDFLIPFGRLRFWSALVAPLVAFLVMGFCVALPTKQEHISPFCLATLREGNYVVPL